MKILFYRYGSICEPEMMEQYSLLGIEVNTIEEEITNKGIKGERRVELVSKRLNSDTFLFVFSINFFPDISNVCEIYGVPYVCWTVDSPLPELYNRAITNSVNRIFVFDKAQYESLSQFISGIYHLPLATNVNRWDQVNSSIGAEDVKNFSGDISFVGSLYSDNDPMNYVKNVSPYLSGFMDATYKVQSKIEGYNLLAQGVTEEVNKELSASFPDYYKMSESSITNIDSYISANLILGMHFSSLTRINNLKTLGNEFNVNLFTRSNCECLKNVDGITIKPGVATLTEMPKVFRLSKINLNMTIYPIEKGLPLRIWDVMGAGGFLLTNYQEELSDYFVPGTDMDYYSETEELIEKCRFYLLHDDIREHIAQNGYEKVKNYHTFTNRMPQMFGKILG